MAEVSVFNTNTEETFIYTGGQRDMQALADLVSGIAHIGDWEVTDVSSDVTLPAFMLAKMARRAGDSQ